MSDDEFSIFISRLGMYLRNSGLNDYLSARDRLLVRDALELYVHESDMQQGHPRHTGDGNGRV